MLALATLPAFAQNDVSIRLLKPQTNDIFGPGQSFNFEVVIKNVGTQDVTVQDTVIYFPTVNGNNLITVNPTTGDTSIVAFGFTGPLNAGDSVVRSQSFGGLTLGGNPGGTVSYCGLVDVVGPNWRSVTEDDENNNISCSAVTYQPGGTVSINELFTRNGAELQLQDNSYFAAGRYHVEVDNVSAAQAEMSFVDLTGRTVSTVLLNPNGGQIRQILSVPALSQGVYLAVLKLDGQVRSTRKFFVR
jgi:hypothetical protein